MKEIDAWIYDPRNALLNGQSKRTALYVLTCERPETCDLLRNENTCLHCGILSPCRFGRKSAVEGPTQRARSFHSTQRKWREEHADAMNRLEPLTAFRRIFRTHEHYYLPYANMAEDIFGPRGSPLKSKWVPVADMTTDLLARICSARPQAVFGGEILSYQKEEVPKFIADLKMFYPDVFYMLPADQGARLAAVSYIGRKAELTTCAPGTYRFGGNQWRWDGELLHGESMLFAPVEGDVNITVRPRPGSSVEITDNNQVTERTRFLD